jgi:adenylate kinase family enzyme
VQRVVVLGPGGAGKTQLAHAISHRTGLPVVHLDPIFWREGWTPAPRDDARRALDAAIEGDRWILDGNFLDTGDDRFQRADAVVFLDLPRLTCLWRILKRLVRDRGRERPDLPLGSHEGFDLPFLRWTWRYPREERPRVLGILAQLDNATAHRLRSRGDVRRFVGGLARESG